MNISDLSAAQLRRAAELKEQLAKLQKELTSILGAPTTPAPAAAPKKKSTMSAAGRRRLSEFHKARWAKIKGKAAPTRVAKAAPGAKPARKKWKLSAAGLERIKAANKAYWAKIKAAKKQ